MSSAGTFPITRAEARPSETDKMMGSLLLVSGSQPVGSSKVMACSIANGSARLSGSSAGPPMLPRLYSRLERCLQLGQAKLPCQGMMNNRIQIVELWNPLQRTANAFRGAIETTTSPERLSTNLTGKSRLAARRTALMTSRTE